MTAARSCDPPHALLIGVMACVGGCAEATNDSGATGEQTSGSGTGVDHGSEVSGESSTSTNGEEDTAQEARAPTVEIVAPFDGAYLGGRAWVLTGKASDDREVVELELRVDGGDWQPVAIEAGAEVEWTGTVSMLAGGHAIEVVARDASGNEAMASVAVHVGAPVAGGGAHTLALGGSGQLYAWGRNNEGQLGIGREGDASTPVLVEGLEGVVGLAANLNHSLALTADGRVFAWGSNDELQLGLGESVDDQNAPTRIEGLQDVVLVAAGQRHGLGVGRDGSLWAWGSNEYGQLGVAEIEGSATPVRVLDVPPMVAVAAGAAHTVAIAEDGSVWTWGRNDEQQLGRGSTAGPAALERLTGQQAASGKSHTLVVAPNGDVFGWGQHALGQVGLGEGGGMIGEPGAVTKLRGAAIVTASGNQSAGIDADRVLWTWGDNFSGQLGTGDREDRFEPTALDSPADVVAVGQGIAHTVARDAEGTVWTWGLDSYGQLGSGSMGGERDRPMPVVFP